MSGREVNLDMAYIILGLHGEIEMISGSTSRSLQKPWYEVFS